MTITTIPRSSATGLDTEMLERFRARAGELDRNNTYFHEDLAELQAIGYLAAPVPVHHGGWGLDLAQLAHSQRRLARYAPAPRWPRRCTSTGSASPRSSSATATTPSPGC